jgi:hypothetical protein
MPLGKSHLAKAKIWNSKAWTYQETCGLGGVRWLSSTKAYISAVMGRDGWKAWKLREMMYAGNRT